MSPATFREFARLALLLQIVSPAVHSTPILASSVTTGSMSMEQENVPPVPKDVFSVVQVTIARWLQMGTTWSLAQMALPAVSQGNAIPPAKPVM